LAIAVGGLISGVLDLLQVCILAGWDTPLYIAGGLLGPKAFQGGTGTYVLGILLHFFVTFSMTATYYAASRRLSFLKEHPLVCGLSFGAAAELVMILIVLPLSALHERGPYELHTLIQWLLVHMVVVGFRFPTVFGGSHNRRVPAFRGLERERELRIGVPTPIRIAGVFAHLRIE